jgi:hypothetical protein
MAAALPYILTAVGTLAQMSAAKAEGDAAYEQAKLRAAQDREQARLEAMALEREANDDRATSQRLAEEQRRASRLRQSKAMALAAASGAGAADVDVLNILGGLQAEGDYNASVELYKGEDSATYKEWRANVARITGENSARMNLYQGKQAKSASRINMLGTLASGAASMYGIYSSKPAGGDVPTQEDEDYNNPYQPGVSTSNWWR